MNPIVVLQEPQDLVNIALVVRAMRNFALEDLRLVAPEDFDPYRIGGIAHGTADVVERIVEFETLDAALADCTYVLGFTARGRAAKRSVVRLREVMPELQAATEEGTAALVFGREDKGLTNAELDRCQRAVVIPTNPDHTSMNLGQAFAVVAYEVFLARGVEVPLKTPRKAAPPARHDELELLFADAREALEAIEFFKTRNHDVVMRAVRTFIQRTPADEREVRLMRGMCLEVVRYLERRGVR